MKNLITLLVAATLLLAYRPVKAQQTTALPPLVSVTGTGEVKVQPDEILIQVGIDVREKTLEAARRQNDERVVALLNFLKKSGIDAKNIQTTHMSIYPHYVGEYGQNVPEFYMAQKSVSVTLKDLKRFDELMNGIYKTGTNRVESIEFRSSELQKHREQARKLAVQAARQKALSLTGELGAKLGRVYSITEAGTPQHPGPLFRGNKMMEASAADAGGPTIAPGQIVVTASVDISFIIE